MVNYLQVNCQTNLGSAPNFIVHFSQTTTHSMFDLRGSTMLFEFQTGSGLGPDWVQTGSGLGPVTWCVLST